MKKCYQCQQEKPIDEFNKNRRRKDGHQEQCRDCQKQHGRLKYKTEERRRVNQRMNAISNINRNRKFIFEYLLDKKCAHCLESNPCVLTFDHLSDKHFAIANGVCGGLSLEKIKLEIEKCQILCANCHMLKTAKENNHYCWQMMQNHAGSNPVA